MFHRQFIQQIEHSKVVAAIAEVEKCTSGEIRVWISSRKTSDAMGMAKKRFDKLGMHNTADRNAVLLYIAPRTQVFAVIGDQGIHEKCGDAFWQEVSTQFSADLKKGDITAALLNAIQKIGGMLTTHFPRKPGDKNQLPDDILRD